MEPIAFSKTISEAYVRRAQAQGNRVAFRHKQGGEWKEVTFAQHFETTKRLACGLMERGVKKGDRIGILAATSLAWSQFDLAILGCASITVPVYPTSTPEDTAFILNHAELGAIFIDDPKNLQKIADLAPKCPKLKLVIVNFEVRPESLKAPFEILQWNALYDLGLNREKTLSSRVDANHAEAQPSDIFTICYTSGTTGTPKGVVLTHSAVSSVFRDVHKVVLAHVTEDEQLLTFLPMSHIFGKWESMTPYFLGWCCSFAESIDTLVANLAEVRPTLWISVPRVFEKVYTKILTQVEQGPAVRRKLFNWALDVGMRVVELRAAGKKPGLVLAAQHETAKRLVFSKISARFGGRLRFCISGAAPLAPNIQMFMHAVGVPVFEGYGLTETCAPVCVNLPGQNKFGTVGPLLPEVLARIADDGEILLKTAKNFREYYKNPEATAEAIKDGWFYTGDIGHLDADGFLKITDRKKDLIKTAGGKFIAPQKIENLAKSHKILSQIVIYGDQRPFAVALVTLNQEYLIQQAQSMGILYGDYAELLKNPAVTKMVDDAFTAINGGLARYETIKKYRLLPAEFTVEGGDLTPSMKIKRKHICEKHKAEIEGMYKA